ncbi:MAG TPA: MarR family transcriptional regulator [Pseudonocardiaceae bacterium]|nr:MarR family transcriptional regulator [Pseudonocardiaceae bacterium]
MSEDQNTEATQDRDETLRESFRSVARLLRQTSVESLAHWDVSPSQQRALRMLTHHGPLRLSGLSDHLRIAPRSTTEVVDDLENKNLVERRPDPQDRRATLVALTEHGVEVVGAIRAAQGAESDRFFDRLSATDQAHLARILRKLRST